MRCTFCESCRTFASLSTMKVWDSLAGVDEDAGVYSRGRYTYIAAALLIPLVYTIYSSSVAQTADVAAFEQGIGDVSLKAGVGPLAVFCAVFAGAFSCK